MWNLKVKIIPIVIGALRTRIDTRTEGLGNNETSVVYPNYSMIEIGQNTEKSPGDLGGLSVSQILVEDHQFTLMRKNLKDSKK